MKTGVANQNLKYHKDFESLIESGYVLDVRGQWTPLNEKVKKERSFIQHLESGEVLNSGKWIPISEFKNPVNAVQSTDEKARFTESSHDETQTSFELSTSDQEEEFPPETIMIAAEELQVSRPLTQESVQKNQQNETADNQFPDTQQEDIVTQETIAMSLHVIAEMSTIHQRPCKIDYDSTTCTVLKAEKKSWCNYGKILLKAAIVALIIGATVYFAFRFFPGSF